MFQKRRRSMNGGIFMAGALVSGIALGITAHKYGPEIRNRVQGLVSQMDLHPFDKNSNNMPQ